MLALTTVALLLTAAQAPADREAHQVVLGGRVVIPIPAGFEAEETALGADRWLLTLRGDGGVLVATVYGGAHPPNRWTALTTHTEELLARLHAEPPSEVRQRLLGHAVTAKDLRYALAGAPWRARLVAGQKDRRTLVVVCAWRDGSPARDTLLHAVEAIVVQTP